LDLIITKQQPIDEAAWNALCLLNSNVLQTTFYDKVKTMFGQYPVYFQCYQNNSLIAGIKAYEYVSKRLPVFKNISSSLTILGEIMYKDNNTATAEKLNEALLDYIKKEKTVRFRASGYYGDLNRVALYNSPINSNILPFNVSSFDLTQSKDVLWKNTKESHRRNINKAIKAGVEIVEDNNINTFIRLLNETYSNQSKQAPNNAFIKKLYESLVPTGMIKIYFAKHDGQYLASSFVTDFGKYAEYAFGGNLKNNIGAGHLLHWHIAMLYQEKKYERYILGQVATLSGNYGDNQKFVEGISRFKRDFATFELPSAAIEWTISPLKYKCWNIIQKIAGV
jgi:lipid II:glycine glycyltransferase (peptidoglycan interpeptide bridge formation enzyme)